MGTNPYEAPRAAAATPAATPLGARARWLAGLLLARAVAPNAIAFLAVFTGGLQHDLHRWSRMRPWVTVLDAALDGALAVAAWRLSAGAKSASSLALRASSLAKLGFGLGGVTLLGYSAPEGPLVWNTSLLVGAGFVGAIAWTGIARWPQDRGVVWRARASLGALAVQIVIWIVSSSAVATDPLSWDAVVAMFSGFASVAALLLVAWMLFRAARAQPAIVSQ